MPQEQETPQGSDQPTNPFQEASLEGSHRNLPEAPSIGDMVRASEGAENFRKDQTENGFDAWSRINNVTNMLNERGRVAVTESSQTNELQPQSSPDQGFDAWSKISHVQDAYRPKLMSPERGGPVGKFVESPEVTEQRSEIQRALAEQRQQAEATAAELRQTEQLLGNLSPQTMNAVTEAFLKPFRGMNRPLEPKQENPAEQPAEPSAPATETPTQESPQDPQTTQ